MANPYPANILDGSGNVRTSGAVFFTDPDNQPGSGSSQTVYVQDADPGAVGAGKVWVTVTDSPPAMRIRDEADADWSPAVLKQLGPLLEDLDGGGKDITNLGTITASTVAVSSLVGDGTTWDVGGARIVGLDDPATAQQAATKNYVDNNAPVSPLADVLVSGDDANGLNISNLADPSDAQQAATKNYVDDLVGAPQTSSNLTVTQGAGTIVLVGATTFVRWVQIGKLVVAHFRVTLDAGTSGAAAVIAVGCPDLPAQHASYANFGGVGAFAGTVAGGSAATTAFITSISPFRVAFTGGVLAPGDDFAGTITYEAA